MDKAYVNLVIRAQQGDIDAFGDLVERFQDMAVGYAWGRVGSLPEAFDASQEAFIDALHKIELLRDPAAFPGWLRSIVATHCTRIRRRREQERGSDMGGMGDPGPEQAVVDRRDATRVRALIEDLPDHQRVVVAMHHLGDCSYAQIAELLGISQGTAKKRAHDARMRLRERWEEVEMTDVAGSVRAARPSRDRQFADSTMLFVAIARENVEFARRLLESNRELADSEEGWDVDKGRRLGLLPPRHGTPLLRAVGRDNRELVQLLLEHGADVNRACGCAGGESPLWAATVAGSDELVRLLLRHGADPNRPAFRGATPLHVAAMRGYDTIAALLVEAGADRHAEDEEGRTPEAWVAIKGGALLTDTAPVTATDSQAIGVIERQEVLESGIKAINLFAPLRTRSLVRWRGAPGSGTLVVLIELLHNLFRLEGLAAEVIGFEYAGLTQAELRHAFSELRPEVRARVRLVPADEPPADRVAMFRDMAAGVLTVRRDEQRRVTVVASHAEHRAELEAVLPRLLLPSDLVIAVELFDQAEQSRLADETTVTFDPTLAKAKLFPAIDHQRSAGAYPNDHHARTAGAARDLLARYRSFDPELTMTGARRGEAWVETARQLHSFLTQPFHTTEPFTGKLGVAVSIGDTLSRAEAILQGNACEDDQRTLTLTND